MAQQGHDAGLVARQQKEAKRVAELKPIIEAIQEEGFTSLNQIGAVLNERGITTARGGEWSATQVMRLLNAING